jgi:hypothetical protein
MTPSSSDTVTIAAAANGVLNITTVDAAGTAGHINLTADGQLKYQANDASGHIFDINGTNQVSIIDGMIQPVTDNDIDLGSAAKSFKDAHIQGAATVGSLVIGSETLTETLIGNIGSGGGVSTDATSAELNILDASATTPGTTAVADGNGIIMQQSNTTTCTTVQTLAAYLDDEITAMPNLVSTGALDGGSITSNFGNINNGSSTISTGTLTSTGGIPNFASGAINTITAVANNIDDEGTTVPSLVVNKINVINYGSGGDDTHFVRLPTSGNLGDMIYAIAHGTSNTFNFVYILSGASTVHLNGRSNATNLNLTDDDGNPEDATGSHLPGTAFLWGPSGGNDINTLSYGGGGMLCILILYKIDGSNKYWASLNSVGGAQN